MVAQQIRGRADGRRQGAALDELGDECTQESGTQCRRRTPCVSRDKSIPRPKARSGVSSKPTGAVRITVRQPLLSLSAGVPKLVASRRAEMHVLPGARADF